MNSLVGTVCVCVFIDRDWPAHARRIIAPHLIEAMMRYVSSSRLLGLTCAFSMIFIGWEEGFGDSPRIQPTQISYIVLVCGCLLLVLPRFVTPLAWISYVALLYRKYYQWDFAGADDLLLWSLVWLAVSDTCPVGPVLQIGYLYFGSVRHKSLTAYLIRGDAVRIALETEAYTSRDSILWQVAYAASRDATIGPLLSRSALIIEASVALSVATWTYFVFLRNTYDRLLTRVVHATLLGATGVMLGIFSVLHLGIFQPLVVGLHVTASFAIEEIVKHRPREKMSFVSKILLVWSFVCFLRGAVIDPVGGGANDVLVALERATGLRNRWRLFEMHGDGGSVHGRCKAFFVNSEQVEISATSGRERTFDPRVDFARENPSIERSAPGWLGSRYSSASWRKFWNVVFAETPDVSRRAARMMCAEACEARDRMEYLFEPNRIEMYKVLYDSPRPEHVNIIHDMTADVDIDFFRGESVPVGILHVVSYPCDCNTRLRCPRDCTKFFETANHDENQVDTRNSMMIVTTNTTSILGVEIARSLYRLSGIRTGLPWRDAFSTKEASLIEMIRRVVGDVDRSLCKEDCFDRGVSETNPSLAIKLCFRALSQASDDTVESNRAALCLGSALQKLKAPSVALFVLERFIVDGDDPCPRMRTFVPPNESTMLCHRDAFWWMLIAYSRAGRWREADAACSRFIHRYGSTTLPLLLCFETVHDAMLMLRDRSPASSDVSKKMLLRLLKTTPKSSNFRSAIEDHAKIFFSAYGTDFRDL